VSGGPVRKKSEPRAAAASWPALFSGAALFGSPVPVKIETPPGLMRLQSLLARYAEVFPAPQRRGSSLEVSFALPDGTIERRSLGPVSLKYAVAQRAIWRREVAERRYAKRQARVKVYTVADLWQLYLTDYRNRRGKDERRWVLAWKHLQPAFNRETTLLRAMFNYGRRTTAEGGKPIVEHMPAFPHRLKENPPRTGLVCDEQYARLVANARELWLRALIALAYSFGFRKGELLNVRVRQVDLMDRWIELETGTTKNGEPRKVRMTSEVFQLMLARVRSKKPDDYVFTRKDAAA
jgi:integrase